MDKIIIRQARIDEVKSLQDLNDKIFENYKFDSDLKLDWAQSESGGKKYFTELLQNKESICLVAELAGNVVGYIAACPKEVSYRLSRYIEIENLGVIPEYRSTGVGSKLMENCLQWAKEKGFQRVYVNSYFQNINAINFYKRNGFAEIDISLEKSI